MYQFHYQSEITQYDNQFKVIRVLHYYCDNKRELLRCSKRQDRYLRSLRSISGKIWYATTINILDSRANHYVYKGYFTQHNTLTPINHIK